MIKQCQNENVSHCSGSNAPQNLEGLCSQIGELIATLRHNQPTPSGWLDVQDVAKELKISRNRVYEIIRSGEIEAVNLAENGSQKNHYRIKREYLDEYLEAKRVVPLSKAIRKKGSMNHVPKVPNRLRI